METEEIDGQEETRCLSGFRAWKICVLAASGFPVVFIQAKSIREAESFFNTWWSGRKQNRETVNGGQRWATIAALTWT
jgi:hypothetical protein